MTVSHNFDPVPCECDSVFFLCVTFNWYGHRANMDSLNKYLLEDWRCMALILKNQNKNQYSLHGLMKYIIEVEVLQSVQSQNLTLLSSHWFTS